jgi:phage shock protein A
MGRHMPSIFKRISDVLAANLNDLIDRVEDPERMAKQIIREMEENIHIAEEGVIDAITSEKQLLSDLEHQRQQSVLWRQRAEEALRADQEDLARDALKRKREHDQVVSTLEPAWEAAQRTSEQLKAQLHALENKLEEAKRKRSTLAARQRAVEARNYLDQTMTSLQAGFDASTNFTRMEDRVAEMEARLAAKAELRRDQSQLERKFEDMHVAKEVDNELAALRQKLLEEPQAS